MADVAVRPVLTSRLSSQRLVAVSVAATLPVALSALSRRGVEIWPDAGCAIFGGLACWCDLRSHRVPDWLTLGGASVVLGWGAVAAAGGRSDVVVGALLGAALFAAILLLPHVVRPQSLGFGDVKLALLLGAVLGPRGFLLVPLAALLAQVVQVCVAIVLGRHRLPFAPALVAGTGFCLLLSLWSAS